MGRALGTYLTNDERIKIFVRNPEGKRPLEII
jgi:hypothetical protein